MKRSTAILAGAGLALSTVLSLGGVALAQDDDVTCAEAIEARAAIDNELRVELGELDPLKAKLKTATAAVVDLKAAVAAAIALDNTKIPPLTEDSAETKAAKAKLANGEKLVVDTQAAVKTQEGVAAEVRVRLQAAIAVVDKECANEPTPTTTSTPEPEPSDLDCNDFPLTDGRNSQTVLDQDKSDPHNLDTDGDGIACEEEVNLNDDEDDVVPDTSNGVATGIA